MKELVSVIIPFYNEEQYIGDCLISLIKQTYKNIEIICVDDGSTDNGAMIVKAIQQSDSRISLIQQENMNAGTARNVGFSKAKGEYVLFLDSDDFFSPLMVERMLNKALSTNSDIVFCTGYGLNVITKETYMMPPVGKDNASFPNKEVFSSADTTDGIFQLSVTWAWDKMYRTDFIRKNDIFFQGTKVCNDLVFVCLSYLFGERITSVNQHFICHRTNIASSLYSAGERNWKCLFEALSELENRLICEDLYNKHRISFLNLVVENIVYYLLMRFTDGNCFSSFYTYYKNNVSDHYNFMQYPIYGYSAIRYWTKLGWYEKNKHVIDDNMVNGLRDHYGIDYSLPDPSIRDKENNRHLIRTYIGNFGFVNRNAFIEIGMWDSSYTGYGVEDDAAAFALFSAYGRPTLLTEIEVVHITHRISKANLNELSLNRQKFDYYLKSKGIKEFHVGRDLTVKTFL